MAILPDSNATHLLSSRISFHPKNIPITNPVKQHIIFLGASIVNISVIPTHAVKRNRNINEATGAFLKNLIVKGYNKYRNIIAPKNHSPIR